MKAGDGREISGVEDVRGAAVGKRGGEGRARETRGRRVMAERKAAECHGGWLARLPGERAVNRIPSPSASLPPVSYPPPPLPSRVPLLYPPRNAHRGILLGQTRSQAWVPPPVFCSTHDDGFSALCGGISMGLHKPNKSLGQRRVLLRYKTASFARSLARRTGPDNASRSREAV